MFILYLFYLWYLSDKPYKSYKLISEEMNQTTKLHALVSRHTTILAKPLLTAYFTGIYFSLHFIIFIFGNPFFLPSFSTLYLQSQITKLNINYYWQYIYLVLKARSFYFTYIKKSLSTWKLNLSNKAITSLCKLHLPMSLDQSYSNAIIISWKPTYLHSVWKSHMYEL